MTQKKAKTAGSNCDGDTSIEWFVPCPVFGATLNTIAARKGSFAYVYGASSRNSPIEKLSLLT